MTSNLPGAYPARVVPDETWKPTGKARDLIERILERCIPEGRCLVYPSKKRPAISYRGVRMTAARALWIEIYGGIPEGLIVRHKCDNDHCLAWEHLILGDMADNARDRIERKRDLACRGTNVWSAKLTDEQVLAIRADTRLGYVIAAEYGVGKAQISRIKNRRERTDV